MTLVSIHMTQREKPFKGFHSTWATVYRFDKHSAKHIISEFKKTPILLNIQYVKKKYMRENYITVSFKNEEDEAAFILLTSGSDYPCVDVEVDEEQRRFWWY